MKEVENMLKDLAREAMFELSDEEISTLINEYHVFMNDVKTLDSIDTKGIEPLVFPYEIETVYLREDEATHIISLDDALKNAQSVQENQIKIPKVVG